MSSLYLGGRCQCPKCGSKSFAAGGKPDPDAPITCSECHHVTTIKEALEAGASPPHSDGSEDFATKGFPKRR